MGQLTNDGFSPYLFEYYKAKLIDDLKLKYPNMSTLDSNPLVIQSTSIAELLAALDMLGLDVYNSRAVKTASGYALEKLVSIAGMSRNAATQSVGYVTFTGTAGTQIPSGTQVQSNTGNIYYTTQTVTIAVGGTVQVEIISTNYGLESHASANTIIIIPFPIFGITAVTNNADIVNGQEEETDPELRERYYNSLSSIGKSTIGAIYARLLQVLNVSTVEVVENATHNTVNGNNPHSIHIYVNGGIENDIHQAIFESRAGGIYCMGSIRKIIPYYKGTYEVAFDRFNFIPVTYTVTIQAINSLWESTYIDDVKQDVLNAINNQTLINKEITFSSLLSATYKDREHAIYDIESFNFTVGGANKTYGDKVILNVGEVPNISIDDISVTVVF